MPRGDILCGFVLRLADLGIIWTNNLVSYKIAFDVAGIISI